MKIPFMLLALIVVPVAVSAECRMVCTTDNSHVLDRLVEATKSAPAPVSQPPTGSGYFYQTEWGMNLSKDVVYSQWNQFCLGDSTKWTEWRKGKCASLSVQK